MGRIYERDGRYGIDYTDHRGKRVRRVVSGDKSVAEKVLGDAVLAREKMRSGLVGVDPREIKRPLQEHFDAYIKDLARRGRDKMYGYIVEKRLEAAAFAEDWKCLRDCSAKSVTNYLSDLADGGKSARTVNGHRADLSAFFAWCVRSGFLEANPCKGIAKSGESKDRTRRALSVLECQALINAAPPDRSRCYLFLIGTGLRRAEAAALNWGHLHLDGVNPYVELPGSITKSGKPETVPLVAEVAAALLKARGEPGEPVFAEIPDMAKFREDLSAAGIAEQDERGRKVVVHSLRHSLATMLAQSKVAPAIAMKILRHRDIRLTLQHYTDDSLLPVTAAMATLPTLTSSPIVEPLRAAN